MPKYVFTCDECGPFELARSMAESGTQVFCPSASARRGGCYPPPRLARLAAPLT